MNDLAIVLISIILLFIVFRRAYYRNKPAPPKELELAVISFLVGAYFTYEASQGDILYNRGVHVDSWQIGVLGTILIIYALYLWRVGMNKREKMKMENN
jgi:RsiW-degrading membrane proteinase PrsW (M82 family)